jgi:DNA-binding IclR family transcriptional regulator
MFSGRPTDLIQSVSRALRILEEVGEHPGGLNAKAISRRCDIALPTTYHLLRTLCYEGYLVRRGSGRYALGMKIASRFRDLLASMERPPNVHDVLRSVSEATGYTAYFAQIIDGRVVLTDLFEGPHSPHLEDLVVGFDEGAHATALGKALLGSMSPAARRNYLKEQGLRPFTGNTIVDPDVLDAELRVSNKQGVFTEAEQYRDEVCCAAVLVDNGRTGAIGLSAGVERWTPLYAALVQRLRMGASDLAGSDEQAQG